MKIKKRCRRSYSKGSSFKIGKRQATEMDSRTRK